MPYFPFRRTTHCKAFGQTLRILLAPDQRLPDHFVFIRAGEVPQEPFRAFRINERRTRTSFCALPSVQLDQMVTVINASLKRWRVLHFPLTAVYVTRRKA